MGLLTNTRKLLITAINDGWHFLLHINCGEMLLFGARLSQHWFGAASFKPHYRDDRCVCVCVCLLSIRSLKRKSSGNQTIQRQSKKSLPPNPSLYECVWVQGPGCLPYLSLPNPFLCTYSSTSWLSRHLCHLRGIRAGSRLLTHMPPHLPRLHLSPDLRVKKKTLQWLSLTLPPEQERRLSVDLSGGHRSGKLQRGKIRELSLTGVCARWISRGNGEIAACVICGWVCQTFGLVLFFNFHSSGECQPKPPAPSQGIFFTFFLTFIQL